MHTHLAVPFGVHCRHSQGCKEGDCPQQLPRAHPGQRDGAPLRLSGSRPAAAFEHPHLHPPHRRPPPARQVHAPTPRRGTAQRRPRRCAVPRPGSAQPGGRARTRRAQATRAKHGRQAWWAAWSRTCTRRTAVRRRPQRRQKRGGRAQYLLIRRIPGSGPDNSLEALLRKAGHDNSRSPGRNGPANSEENRARPVASHESPSKSNDSRKEKGNIAHATGDAGKNPMLTT